MPKEVVKAPEEQTEEEIVNWNIYSNEKYGFEIKYPPEILWEVIPPLSTPITPILKSFSTTTIGAFATSDLLISIVNPEITYFAYGDAQDRVNLLQNFRDVEVSGPFEEQIGRNLVYMVSDKLRSGSEGVNRLYYFPNLILKFSFADNRAENSFKYLERQILSTFRFIGVPDETADWKTYRNEEYGFEMKYPEDLLPTQPLQPKTKVLQCDHADFINNCPTEKTTINNIPFCLQKTSEGAAGTTYVTYNYTTVFTVKDEKCFIVSFTVPYPNCSNYLPIESQEIQQMYDKCKFDNEVTKPETINKILSTFRFLD